IAAPLGSFLGGIIGWRNVFNAAAVMGVLCVIWVVKSLPSLPGMAALSGHAAGSETASDRVDIADLWYIAVAGEYDVGAGAAVGY
ncbi:hypothetical protein MJL79_28645, partial [Salmonella enterica subsp. enterica serovar Montevideo]|nr:hypothetical protein [Salmonella enterica subsp. enterica serovar Montevideo]